MITREGSLPRLAGALTAEGTAFFGFAATSWERQNRARNEKIQKRMAKLLIDFKRLFGKSPAKP
jgi:hypothetical protein